MMMNKFLTAAVSLILLAAADASGNGKILRITNLHVFKKLSRTVVEFPHERHYTWGMGCLDCHHRYSGDTNMLDVNELYPGSPAASCSTCHNTSRELERSYHRMCTGCHRDMKARGNSYGPVMCGKCHSGRRDL